MVEPSPIRDNPSIKPYRGVINLVRAFRGAYGLVQALGIRHSKLDEIAGAADKVLEHERLIDLPDRFNSRFASLGWICTDSLSVPVMERALALADEGHEREAEAHIADFFDEEALHRCAVWRSRRFHKEAAREEQIEQAIRLYLDGLYWGALPLVLVATDGLGSDVTNLSIFKDGEDLTLFDSVVGHPSGLHALVKQIARTRKKTTAEVPALPFRNGILHGRDLGYADRVTCAKGWMLFVALVDWAISRSEVAKRHMEHEHRTATTWKVLAEQLLRNNEAKRAIDAWTPRSLSGPFEGPLDEHTPEAAIEAFLRSWAGKNYGRMGHFAINLTGKTERKMAGEMRADAEAVRLILHEILSLEQPTVAAATAKVRLHARGFDMCVEDVFEIGAMRVGPAGQVPMPNEPGGWQVRQSIIWNVRRALRQASKG